MFYEIEAYFRIKFAYFFSLLSYILKGCRKDLQDNFFKKTIFFNCHSLPLNQDPDNVQAQTNHYEVKNFFQQGKHLNKFYFQECFIWVEVLLSLSSFYFSYWKVQMIHAKHNFSLDGQENFYRFHSDLIWKKERVLSAMMSSGKEWSLISHG